MVFTASLLEIPHQRGSVKHQMAEWYGASASGLVDLWFDSESGQTNDFKIGIHSFPALRSAFKGQCGEQAGKFTLAVGKGT